MMDERQKAGEVISYMEMCSAIGVNLQRGMNFRLREPWRESTRRPASSTSPSPTWTAAATIDSVRGLERLSNRSFRGL